jgi:hypothetical protein
MTIRCPTLSAGMLLVEAHRCFLNQVCAHNIMLPNCYRHFRCLTSGAWHPAVGACCLQQCCCSTHHPLCLCS